MGDWTRDLPCPLEGKWDSGAQQQDLGNKVQVISTLDSLQRLSLVSPPVHPSQTVDQIGPPRITPLPQLLLPPGLDHLRSQAASRNDIGEEVDDKLKAVGQGGWGLGRAWENLEVLELANLSQAGVSSLN